MWDHQSGDCADLPSLDIVLENCYLRGYGCPVTAEIHMAKFSCEMSLMVRRITKSLIDQGEEWKDKFLPSVRIALSVEPVAVCRIRGQCDVGLESGPDCHSCVIDNIDEIVFVDDDGREFDFPKSVEWYGSIGAGSPEAWNDYELPEIGDDDCGGGAFSDCCRHARQLTGLSIGTFGRRHYLGDRMMSEDLYFGSIELTGLPFAQGDCGEDCYP